MQYHDQLSDKSLHGLIRKGAIRFGGNARSKIYGLLNCHSGKRMKTENRVFFENEQDAIAAKFRPCGHCQPIEYKKWKFPPEI